ncbi:uncharacterized protein EI97DRAFT_433076 [Westerdykella ornata]|uniref:Uncharacterized protein n=1 Tax=Westerdykella ornata TaxID=318751 RepID=A0A6A6JKQ5_WESOR|nr:uncharacterized protein EI97DRAFT_433076 [Westerdykella ornata]KAF2276844.1 hypothetical protein EI97DRAFT_433076 [Westerdykella ornata]
MLAPVQSFLCALAIGAAQALRSSEELPHFTLKAARANLFSDVTHTHELSTRDILSAHDLRTVRSESGDEAIVDESLLRRGVLAASGTDFVDLSWDPLSPTTPYLLIRDGEQLANLTAGTTAYRDTTATPGSTYRYDIVPLLKRDDLNPNAERWSLQVHTPARDTNTTSHIASIAKRAAATTTLSWVTFIPQKRIDAPVKAGVTLCTYGKGYQFGGDNHGFDWKASSYRTAAHAVITWSSKKVEGHTSVGTTHVYKKSTGKLVSEKTASKKDMVAKKLGASGSSVDIRMVTHAKNPYCPGGAIDGAFTMSLSKGGSWSIRSGNHRQMPNHHVYIYNGGKVTNVYTRKYASEWCLVGGATCDLANLGGLYGDFK